MYEYRSTINKIIDGDTVDVDIDLGFGVVLSNERVRIMGIDTPESRTRDKVEKVFGLAAKYRLKELLGAKPILKTVMTKKGEDMKGKFGRILGDFLTDDGVRITQIMIDEGHAVPYTGQNKDDVLELHMINRKRLISEGVVDEQAVLYAASFNK
jgi:micrococcal nuclease|tara:strand:+ start:21005 stop:21466 length:462 start_codon:yes stop_codon:yes gene_type:complete